MAKEQDNLQQKYDELLANYDRLNTEKYRAESRLSEAQHLNDRYLSIIENLSKGKQVTG